VPSLSLLPGGINDEDVDVDEKYWVFGKGHVVARRGISHLLRICNGSLSSFFALTYNDRLLLLEGLGSNDVDDHYSTE
jgi:hypothetical protein